MFCAFATTTTTTTRHGGPAVVRANEAN